MALQAALKDFCRRLISNVLSFWQRKNSNHNLNYLHWKASCLLFMKTFSVYILCINSKARKLYAPVQNMSTKIGMKRKTCYSLNQEVWPLALYLNQTTTIIAIIQIYDPSLLTFTKAVWNRLRSRHLWEISGWTNVVHLGLNSPKSRLTSINVGVTLGGIRPPSQS